MQSRVCHYNQTHLYGVKFNRMVRGLVLRGSNDIGSGGDNSRVDNISSPNTVIAYVIALRGWKMGVL